MQKKSFIYIALLGLVFFAATRFILFNTSQVTVSPSVEASVLINHLENTSFHLQMIYGNINMQDIQVYDVTSDQFSIHETPYTSFTEGFIAKDLNETLLACVNQFRALQKMKAISYYYQYTETDHYYFISLSDGLDTLYIIDKLTYKVYTPYVKTCYDNASDDPTTHLTEKQYVYHIQESADALYVLTAKSNSYHAYLYQIDKQTFELIGFKEILPSSLAVYSDHYALSATGVAFFIEEKGLQVESLNNSYHLPLTFSPTHLYLQKGQPYVLGLSKQTLDYMVFDENLSTFKTGSLPLPNQDVHLLTTWLSDSLFYTVTYDPNHPVYGNYLTLYDLSTGKILYCMGLKRSIDLTLLDTYFISTSI